MQGHHGGAGGRVGHRAGTAQAQGQGRRMRIQKENFRHNLVQRIVNFFI